jgi:hypothetical protein
LIKCGLVVGEDPRRMANGHLVATAASTVGVYAEIRLVPSEEQVGVALIVEVKD